MNFLYIFLLIPKFHDNMSVYIISIMKKEPEIGLLRFLVQFIFPIP